MEFLRRHYEKLILLALAIISIITVLHLVSIVGRTKEVKDSDLKIPTRQPDYEVHDAKSAEFVTPRLIAGTALLWPESQGRIKDENGRPKDDDSNRNFSDLVKVFKMARCPHCSKIVPFYYFSDRNCPECGKELKTPTNVGKPRRIRMITGDDSDGDGINDADEQRLGLNSGDPSDALFDMDGDGFSNLYEIENNFDPRIPNSCPPLWYRLRFRGVDRVELPIRLTSVDTGGQEDKNRWDALIKMQRRNSRGQLIWRDSSYNIGDTLQFDGRDYRVAEMSSDRKVQKVRNADGSEIEKTVDNSSVTLIETSNGDDEAKKVKPEKLVLTVGQPVYSPDRRVILEDIGIPADENGRRPVYGLREGDKFTIGGIHGIPGGNRVIPLTLKLVRFDENAKTALLENARSRSGADASLDKNGMRMLVTAMSEIPEDLWVTPATSGGETKPSETDGGESPRRRGGESPRRRGGRR